MYTVVPLRVNPSEQALGNFTQSYVQHGKPVTRALSTFVPFITRHERLLEIRPDNGVDHHLLSKQNNSLVGSISSLTAGAEYVQTIKSNGVFVRVTTSPNTVGWLVGNAFDMLQDRRQIYLNMGKYKYRKGTIVL